MWLTQARRDPYRGSVTLGPPRCDTWLDWCCRISSFVVIKVING